MIPSFRTIFPSLGIKKAVPENRHGCIAMIRFCRLCFESGEKTPRPGGVIACDFHVSICRNAHDHKLHGNGKSVNTPGVKNFHLSAAH
jgi:hypothetical protein